MKRIISLLLIGSTILFSTCKKKLNCGDVVAPAVTSNSPVPEQGVLKLYVTSSEPELSFIWTGPNGFSSNEQNPVLSYTGYEAAGTYHLQMFSGSCPAPEVNVEVNVVAATPLCSPNNNTLNFVNYFNDQTYSSCYASTSSGYYKLSAGNISSDIRLQFNTSTEPPLGLYDIEPYPCNICGANNVELYLLAGGNLLSTPGGKLYLQKVGGKITATFCGLTVYQGGYTTTVDGKLKAN